MLHVTNGSAAARVLGQAGLGGDILTWDDALHEGPVPDGLGRVALSRERARFVAASGWADEVSVAEAFAARDARLATHHEEVVLWFEHDLYDQLQLLQVLDHLYGTRARVTAVPAHDYVSYQTPARLADWHAARQVVTDAQWRAAEFAWAAFRAPDPELLAGLLPHLTAWPHLPAALRRHLQQFPSRHTGLSRTEGQAMAVLSEGGCSLRELFAATQQLESPVFMGDEVFRTHLAQMIGPGGLVRPDAAWSDDPWSARLALTPAGEAVLEGTADRVERCGLDRWLGGVHLRSPGAIWRWDEDAGRIVTT